MNTQQSNLDANWEKFRSLFNDIEYEKIATWYGTIEKKKSEKYQEEVYALIQKLQEFLDETDDIDFTYNIFALINSLYVGFMSASRKDIYLCQNSSNKPSKEDNEKMLSALSEIKERGREADIITKSEPNFCDGKHYAYNLLSLQNKEQIHTLIKQLIERDLSSHRKIINRNSLYQYTKIDKNSISNILSNKIWLSHPQNFNDLMDPPIKRFLNENEINVPHIDIIDYNEFLLDTIKIACLSTCPLNTLMWAHYADKHQGICIEYDIVDLLEKQKNNKNIVLKEVSYGETITNDYMDRQVYKIEGKKHMNILDIFSFKHQDWEYEKEYRIIQFKEPESKGGVSLEDLSIKSIYFGMNCKEEDKELIKKLIKNQCGQEHKIAFYNVEYQKNNILELEKDK